MNWRGLHFLGWRYVRKHSGRVCLMIGVFTVTLTLPCAIYFAVRQADDSLQSRARSTPLLFGAAGSPLELVFNSLYFSEPGVPPLSLADAEALKTGDLARVLPLHAHFEARRHRIVGLTLDYFRFRNLEIAQGRLMTRLGDCVLGSETARRLGLGPGDTLVSTPDQLFDLAGVYPLKMRITGVLKPSGTPDDHAVLCDLKTVWIIAGLSHGHEDAAESEEVLQRDDENVTLNAAVREFQEVTEENVHTFHFHGTPEDLPLTGAIVLPRDEKAETILLGRFQAKTASLQLFRPATVMRELFETVFKVRDLIIAALATVGLAAATIAALVFVLSNRLRQQEFVHLAHLGASGGSVRYLILFEAAFTLLASLLLSALLLALALAFLPGAMQAWLS